jgi:hypothetical protein
VSIGLIFSCLAFNEAGLYWQPKKSDYDIDMKYLKQMLFLASLMLFFSCNNTVDWRTASRESAHIAPLPKMEKAAVVQIYGAKTYSWRGHFSLHTWIATKEKNASTYVTYQVLGWRTQRGLDTIEIEKNIPDRYWYGSKTELIASYTGKKAEEMIPLIEVAAKNYPYPKFYRAWPGPNSNTFISHIIRSVPGMGVELPSNAIGKDWIHNNQMVGWSETKTGVQLSVFGVCGITLGLGEGVEIDLLGLSFGIDFLRPALKLPLIGRLGMKDADVF